KAGSRIAGPAATVRDPEAGRVDVTVQAPQGYDYRPMTADLTSSAPGDIALSPQIRENERALLHALLQAADYGVLLTDLRRQDVLANRRMGELFAVSPHTVVETPPEGVRDMVRTRVADPEAFDRRLEAIYSDPTL